MSRDRENTLILYPCIMQVIMLYYERVMTGPREAILHKTRLRCKKGWSGETEGSTECAEDHSTLSANRLRHGHTLTS